MDSLDELKVQLDKTILKFEDKAKNNIVDFKNNDIEIKHVIEINIVLNNVLDAMLNNFREDLVRIKNRLNNCKEDNIDEVTDDTNRLINNTKYWFQI
jgi:hypothetical protein